MEKICELYDSKTSVKHRTGNRKKITWRVQFSSHKASGLANHSDEMDASWIRNWQRNSQRR